MARGGKRPGSGRPKREERVPLSAKVLPETKKKLGQLAFDLVVSVGDVLDRITRRYKNKSIKTNENNTATGKDRPKNPPYPKSLS